MKAFKGYLKSTTPIAASGTGAAAPAAPARRQDVYEIGHLPTQRPFAAHRLTNQSRSSFVAGGFHSDSDLMSMKSDLMTEFLYKQQCLKLWTSSNAEEGVVLKRTRGDYTSCPDTLRSVRGGLFEQVVAMNVRCAMTVKTNVISLFVASQPGDLACLQGGLSIQILPSISHLSQALKHQFAAFIRDRQCLVVWDDEPEKLIEHTHRLESLLIATIWNDGVMYADDEKQMALESLKHVMDVPRDEDENGFPGEPRRVQLLSPFIVSLTLCLIIVSLAVGWRKLAVEVKVDDNYTRLALIATSPLIFFVGIFTMQAVASNIMQVIGPVNQIMENTKAYSGKPPKRIIEGIFPHITIQMPVYKEGLSAVIKPTVMSLKAAISTYELQGGTANIFVNDDGMQLISEEDAAKRRDFYAEHNIGWVARPKHNPRPRKPEAGFDDSKIFVRKGKFKKASNMNFALMVSNKLEDKLLDVNRFSGWTVENETEAYKGCFKEVLRELNGKAWAEGNIRMGDYILIVDSDTRVPQDCLLDAASEMEQSPEVAIMQFTSGVMKVTNSYFESGITFFTNLVYTSIRYAVASGDVCPFVGHNAVLRWSALQQIAYTDEDGYEKFWSESHVSEDFDMALRLQCAGYQLRLAAYQGEGFKEGVSLTVYDELARWEKYAYGCNELLFHPIRFWFVKGPFTPLFRKFVSSSMPIGAKLTILAYIGTYYAIGSAWILTLANYFMIGWFIGYLDQFYLDSFAITFAVIIVFSALTNLTLAILRYRTNEKGLFAALWENFKWVPLLSIFLSGVSLHVSQALLAHMFEIDMTWGATSKEVENTSFFEEMPKLIKRFRFTFIFCILCTALMITGATLFPVFWRINTIVAIYPLASIVVGHFLLPVALNPALMMFTW